MKTLIKLSIVALAFILMSTECQRDNDINPNEPIDIPDEGFLNALIKDGVDTNRDGLISYSEAEATVRLEFYTPMCGHMGMLGTSWDAFTSFEGIEAFKNLVTLISCVHDIETLDLSQNTALAYLNLIASDLTSLDLSNNTSLVHLNLKYNNLSSLDLLNNTALTYLDLGFNPLLNEVCVFWDDSLLQIGVINIDILTEGSPNIHFTTDCSK